MMGSSQSPGSKEHFCTEITNLGDQIENALTREVQDAVKNTLLNYGNTKEIYKKRSEEIVELQKKFSKYKKLINVVRTLSITNASDLRFSSVEYKRKINKLTKYIQDLEDTCSRNLSYQKSATEELAREIELKQKAENELLSQIQFYQEKCKANELEVKKLEEELNRERKLQEQVTLKIEQQFQQGRSNHESRDILRITIDTQIQTIKQLQREQKEKDQKIETLKQTARNEEKCRLNLQIEIDTLGCYKKEKENLSTQLLDLKCDLEREKAEKATKIEEIDTVSHKYQLEKAKLQNMVDSKNKLHAINAAALENTTALLKQYNAENENLLKDIQLVKDELEKEKVKNKTLQKVDGKFANSSIYGGHNTQRSTNKLHQDTSIALKNTKAMLTQYKAEKKKLLKDIQLVKDELEKEKVKNKTLLKVDGKFANSSIYWGHNTQRSTNKLHQDTSIALENTNTMLIQYKAEKEKLLKDIQLVKDELEKEKVKNKTLEESDKDKTTKCEKHEVELQQQREEIKKLEAMYKSVVDFQVACQQTTKEVTKMVEDKLAKEIKHRKQIQGQLYLLQGIHNNLKAFCRNDLRQRKDFSKEVAKGKKGADQKVDDSGKMETVGLEDNASGILNWKKHNSHTENLLEETTREIAVLKNELKMKADEVKKLAVKEWQSSRKEEMLELHEQFLESLKFFNDPHAKNS